MSNANLYERIAGLDMEGSGYFGEIIGLQNNDDCPHKEWEVWEQCLKLLGYGDFSVVPTLIDVWRTADSHVLRYNTAILLADTMTTDGIQYLREKMEDERDTLMKIDYAEILAKMGNLNLVREILEVHETVAAFNDSEIIAIQLSDLLEQTMTIPFPEDSSFETYKKSVNTLLMKTHAQFPNEELSIYQGKPTNVKKLVKNMLQKIHERNFECDLRRRFEATTGVDCSSFYKNEWSSRSFQPQAATELLKSYFKSGKAEAFEDGVRYFFGYRIP